MKAAKRTAHNKRTHEQFIELAKAKHGNQYSYENTQYINNITKVKIICPVHGEFEQTPKHHLRGEGCFQCGRDLTGKKKTKTTAEFIANARSVHGNKYDYSKTVYTGASNKVEIICPQHGSFYQKATHHISKVGCPHCASEITGWSRGNFRKACNGDLGVLYVIECHNDTELFFKIGITSKSVQLRFKDIRKMPYQYTELFTISGKSDDIYDLEKKLHAKLKQSRYNPMIGFHGQTECFSTIEPIKEFLTNNLLCTQMLNEPKPTPKMSSMAKSSQISG